MKNDLLAGTRSLWIGLRQRLLPLRQYEGIYALIRVADMRLDLVEALLRANADLERGDNHTRYYDGYAVGYWRWENIFDQAATTTWVAEYSSLTELEEWVTAIEEVATKLSQKKVPQPEEPIVEKVMRAWERDLLGL